MILPIIQSPDERLLTTSLPVDLSRSVLSGLMTNLIDTRIHSKALGLSAVQVGIHLRVIAVAPKWCEGISIMVNPVIVARGREIINADERCMSIGNGVPRFPVNRHKIITVQFQDRDAKDRSLVLKGMGARLVQHEVDHLDGKLIA